MRRAFRGGSSLRSGSRMIGGASRFSTGSGLLGAASRASTSWMGPHDARAGRTGSSARAGCRRARAIIHPAPARTRSELQRPMRCAISNADTPVASTSDMTSTTAITR
jgi:hypothetical protein